MALIDSNANVIEDAWHYPDASHTPAAKSDFVIPFDIFTTVAAGCAVERPIGILVTPEIAPEQIAPYLDKIDLVAVHFEEPRDVQGFTTALALRQHHGFKGDIRALGRISPDQRELLAHLGLSSIRSTDRPLERWITAPSGTSWPVANSN